MKYQKKITSKTGAILIVHMYGLACKIDEIKKIAKEKNYFLSRIVRSVISESIRVNM